LKTNWNSEAQFWLPMTWLWLMLLVLLVACAGLTPESKLERGYHTVSASAKAATVLLQRGLISPDEAQRALELGEIGKASLDAGKTRLRACRDAEATGQKVDCDSAVSTIDLGSGVLAQLETYLSRIEEAK
jgi:hypothetical protein